MNFWDLAGACSFKIQCTIDIKFPVLHASSNHSWHCILACMLPYGLPYGLWTSRTQLIKACSNSTYLVQQPVVCKVAFKATALCVRRLWTVRMSCKLRKAYLPRAMLHSSYGLQAVIPTLC